MNISLQAQARKTGKKSDIKNLRKDGFIPAIIYGEGKEGKMISLQEIDFMKNYSKSIGKLVFFDVNVENESYLTILKDKQVHPVSRKIVHIDFQEIHKGKEITVNIPIRYVGEAPGTKSGGILEVLYRDLEVVCLPKDIPDDIEIDISNLNLGDAIHVADIDLGNLQTKVSDDTPVISVQIPRSIKEDEEEETEAEEEVAPTE